MKEERGSGRGAGEKKKDYCITVYVYGIQSQFIGGKPKKKKEKKTEYGKEEAESFWVGGHGSIIMVNRKFPMSFHLLLL